MIFVRVKFLTRNVDSTTSLSTMYFILQFHRLQDEDSRHEYGKVPPIPNGTGLRQTASLWQRRKQSEQPSWDCGEFVREQHTATAVISVRQGYFTALVQSVASGKRIQCSETERRLEESRSKRNDNVGSG